MNLQKNPVYLPFKLCSYFLFKGKKRLSFSKLALNETQKKMIFEHINFNKNRAGSVSQFLASSLPTKLSRLFHDKMDKFFFYTKIKRVVGWREELLDTKVNFYFFFLYKFSF